MTSSAVTSSRGTSTASPPSSTGGPTANPFDLSSTRPKDLAKFIAVKGSVTLDGVSLTVNEMSGTRFGVNIIPHTLACSNFGAAKPGQRMNLEIDLIARYVARLLGARAEGVP